MPIMNLKQRATHIEELRKQLEAAEAEQARAHAEEKRRVQAAHKAAGASHTSVALALYDRLDVLPEHPRSRLSRGAEREVASDRNETQRSDRLLTMLHALIDAADPALVSRLQHEDRQVRDSRKPVARVPEAEVDRDGQDPAEPEFDRHLQAV